MSGGGTTFPKTLWTMVQQASIEGPQMVGGALGSLCVTYAGPIREWLRKHGVPPEQVDDVVQGFLEHLLVGNRFASVDRSKGRFRSFLLKCLQRYRHDVWRKTTAAKRGGGALPVEFDDGLAGAQPSMDETLDRPFAIQVHQTVMNRLRGQFRDRGQRTRFAELEPLLLGTDDADSYDEIGTRLGMSRNAVKQAVFRFREDYARFFHDEIAQIAVPEQVADETRYLITLIPRTSARTDF